jgi:hypothetical protein
MEMHHSLAKQDLILNNFQVTEYVSQGLLQALNLLKTESVLNNIQEFSLYLTGNTLHLCYKDQPFTAEPAISLRYTCTWRYIPDDRNLHKYLPDFSKILRKFLSHGKCTGDRFLGGQFLVYLVSLTQLNIPL